MQMHHSCHCVTQNLKIFKQDCGRLVVAHSKLQLRMVWLQRASQCASKLHSRAASTTLKRQWHSRSRRPRRMKEHMHDTLLQQHDDDYVRLIVDCAVMSVWEGDAVGNTSHLFARGIVLWLQLLLKVDGSCFQQCLREYLPNVWQQIAQPAEGVRERALAVLLFVEKAEDFRHSTAFGDVETSQEAHHGLGQTAHNSFTSRSGAGMARGHGGLVNLDCGRIGLPAALPVMLRAMRWAWIWRFLGLVGSAFFQPFCYPPPSFFRYTLVR